MDNQRRSHWTPLVIVLVLGLGGAEAAGPAKFLPARGEGGLVLFGMQQHDLADVRNYTASWKKGSDLVPIVTRVAKDGESWAEFAFRGSKGSACSTFYFDTLPEPDAGKRYDGIVLVLDCDRDDYPHIGVQVKFSDNTQVSQSLTLERGRHEYLVDRGFRRVKYPPRWELTSYVMLSLDAGRHDTGLQYRLQRITLRENAVPPEAATTEHLADLFGEPILLPQPKEVAWKEDTFPAREATALALHDGASKRTRRTAELFADRYADFTGCPLATESFDQELPSAGIILCLADAWKTSDGEAVLRPQGYLLSVEGTRVVIVGADERGLYYGTTTFFQLLRHALKRPAAPRVSCVTIRDWPDTPNRLIRLEHPGTFRNYPVRENRGIDYLIDWTDRFVVGNKFTTLYLDIASNVRYERRPEFNGSEKIYSLDDLRRFGDFCRDHFIDLCPAWQVGGHANWWLTIGYHPELREKGWANQGDVTHPDHDKVVFDCMLDVIEALQPKYVSPKSDEWWSTRRSDETPDELLRGKPRAQAFLDFHVRLNNWLKERGITMMIFEDMLSPYHNGKKFDTYRIIDAFPKDVILTQWSGGNLDKEIRYFTERGFHVWPNATSMFTLSEESKARVMGFGKAIYSFGNDGGHLPDEYSQLSSISTVFQTADYGWNLHGTGITDPARLLAAEQTLAIRPNPRSDEQTVPISLRATLADSLADFLKRVKPEVYGGDVPPIEFPHGQQQIGFISMRLGGSGGDCAILRKDSEPVTLLVEGRFASLVFLHTAFVNDPADKNLAGAKTRAWMYGWPCGDYVVHYADGTIATLPVRLTNNIKRFDTASRTRATLDCRYTWSLDDAHGDPVHFFQWEWVNPRPDVPIERVVVEHDGILDVSLLVFALTGRPVRVK